MNILQMSIAAGILVTAIIIVRAIALNRLPKTMFLILWGVALCRLLIPVSFPSWFSIYNIIGTIFNKGVTVTQVNIIENVLRISNPTAEITRQITQAAQEQAFSVPLATLIWFAGTLTMVIFFATMYFKNYRELRFTLRVRGNDFFDEWLVEHGLLRPITIMQSDRITTPVAVGMMKPRIILPKSMNMDDRELLRYILAHEYYHIRRLDTLWKVLLTGALCIHWFNPMVWVMFILVNRDLELTCDEMVIRHFGTDTKTAYAYSIIGMAEQRRKFTPLYNGFSKNAAEERIISIMKIKKTSVLSIVIATILVVGLTTAFVARADKQTNDVMPQDAITDWAQYDTDGNLVYYHTVDENGSDVFLDYEPEIAKGDAELGGENFTAEIIDCIDGTAGEHKEANGRMAVYTNNGGAWPLSRGQVVAITFSVKAIQDREIPQGIIFGYLKDGVYTEYTEATYRLQDETSFTFKAPEDGDYGFFFINASSDTIYVNSFTVSG